MQGYQQKRPQHAGKKNIESGGWGYLLLEVMMKRKEYYQHKHQHIKRIKAPTIKGWFFNVLFNKGHHVIMRQLML